jgi:hypothetical protein
MSVILALLLAAGTDCRDHRVPGQRQDAASVRRVDSAWSTAYVHADTTFLRCLLAPDYVNYALSGTVDLAGELAKAARAGDPRKPIPALPTIEVQIHGASAVADGIANGRRWVDVYAFENGVWRAYFSADVKIIPGPAPGAPQKTP